VDGIRHQKGIKCDGPCLAASGYLVRAVYGAYSPSRTEKNDIFKKIILGPRLFSGTRSKKNSEKFMRHMLPTRHNYFEAHFDLETNIFAP